MGPKTWNFLLEIKTGIGGLNLEIPGQNWRPGIRN
jgi:hypothetical protein